MSDLVTLTIDGRQVSVPKGTLLVEAARTVGIDIPVFCYHPKLKPAGACRMCLVEIERMPKLQTACTTPVSEGMVVHTDTPTVAEARKSVLEFLLINHPLDCPVCDKGGECPLQDNTFAYGPSDSRYQEPKRRFRKPIPISEHILLDRERCIMCFRCVRFQEEIAIDPCLTALDRGTWSEIGVAPGRKFDSIFSGNTIELCPVGALTSAHFRFRARPWDITPIPSICNQCGVGCNVRIDVRDDRIVRILSRENPEVDDGWLCDLGRFTYEYLNAEDRPRYPEARTEGQLSRLTWEQALRDVAERVRSILDESGPESIGVLVDPRLTNEELYIVQKFARALGTNNIDHRLDGYYPGKVTILDVPTGSIAELAQANTVMLVGADPLAHQPIVDLWVKKAYRRGATLVYLGPDDTDLARLAHRRIVAGQATLGDTLLAVVKALLETVPEMERPHLPVGAQLLETVLRASWPLVERMAGAPKGTLEAVARAIAAGQVALLFPRRLLSGAGADVLATGLFGLTAASTLLSKTGLGLYPLPEDANEQGALDLGVTPNLLPGYAPIGGPATGALEEAWGFAIPRAVGLGGAAMLEALRKGDLRCLIVVGLDLAAKAYLNPSLLEGLDLLVLISSFRTPLDGVSHFRLPLRSFAEKGGTYTNLEGRIQKAEPALVPRGEALDAVEIFGALGKMLGLWGEVQDMGEVLREIARILPTHRGLTSGLEPFGFRRQLTASSLLEAEMEMAAPSHWREAAAS